jgi:hypothetical protein
LARHQLGRVTGAVDVPRGPDVQHRIRVRAEWVDEGAAVEFELPRNLKCAACEGGGCDRCERSGAISVRGRKELGEVVQVTLPKRDESSIESTASGRSLVIRIPQRGGFSDDPDLPRGILMLQVVPADEADPGVIKVELPPPSVEEQVAEPAEPAPLSEPTVPMAQPKRTVLTVVIVLVILWISFLIWMRATGKG